MMAASRSCSSRPLLPPRPARRLARPTTTIPPPPTKASSSVMTASRSCSSQPLSPPRPARLGPRVKLAGAASRPVRGS
ncbi:hypothetical protein RHGRI_025648 [Rhododendron griersonianum]|uniref:Uncharacterized protein n=1 Tax=Rhododendron griersonianum TaxID=479676 RepID=A0AAV6IR50_9ERIC|nr:hypothetical protein RHGRI_025648 [Rhododendron griersonianum]